MVRPAKISDAALRGLGHELRRLRHEAGMTMDQLVAQIGLSRTVLSRVENAQQLLPQDQIGRLLGAVGASDEDYDHVMELARKAQSPNWLAMGLKDKGSLLQIATLKDYEDGAQSITSVSMVVVPGLLQTRDYAEAVLLAAGVAPMDVAQRVEFRLLRQQVVSKGTMALRALIDESVFHRPFGGRAVAAAQFRHLLRVAEQSEVALQVIPYHAEYQPVDGSFMILESRTRQPSVVYWETRIGGLFMDEGRDVADVVESVGRLSTYALGPAESADLIREAAEEMEHQ